MNKEEDNGSPWLTPAEVAERFKFHIRSVHRLCRQGLIPARKLGKRRWVIDGYALECLIKSDPSLGQDSKTATEDTQEK
jgi:hypothetical protein